MAIVIVRTLIVYFALVLFMRLMGKRQLGELELPELAVAVLIADLQYLRQTHASHDELARYVFVEECGKLI